MVKTLDNVIINAKARMAHAKQSFKTKVSGDETLIIKIMLMVIAVALVLIFKDSLTTIIKNLLTGTDNNGGLQKEIQNMYNSATTPTT